MEIWKDIKGFEGLYQVSNLGNIKSMSHTVTMPHRDGGTRTRTRTFVGRKISQWLSKRGYYCVTLKNRGYKRHFTVHRLVALSFIENNSQLATINHINGIKTDNRVENLEWCTQSENVKHAHDTGLNKGSGRLIFDECSGIYFNSCLEASRSLGVSNSTLSLMLNGRLKNRTNLRYA